MPESIHFLSSLPSVWVKDYVKASNHHYHQLSVTRNFFQFTISIKFEARSRLIKSQNRFLFSVETCSLQNTFDILMWTPSPKIIGSKPTYFCAWTCPVQSSQSEGSITWAQLGVGPRQVPAGCYQVASGNVGVTGNDQRRLPLAWILKVLQHWDLVILGPEKEQ